MTDRTKNMVATLTAPVWLPPCLLIAAEWRIGPKLRLLDRMKPGWHNEISLTRLDLSSNTDCVLGQLYGHFYKAPLRLNWRSCAGIATFSWLRARGWVAAIEKRRLAEARAHEHRRALVADLIARAERPKGQQAREEEVGKWVR